jgi:hypothetical protein
MVKLGRAWTLPRVYGRIPNDDWFGIGRCGKWLSVGRTMVDNHPGGFACVTRQTTLRNLRSDDALCSD